ncbi:UDP-N-acetylglucosamine 4,6-dehydratase [hydrothermal vent metagenome]|uniref:UDP-N-acetylglucosamine 4,6-dehydratase n=1 Tax=hydrothermal vent metagenome TaxID=652676 RepID=A0A3B1A620_9ZZZZ
MQKLQLILQKYIKHQWTAALHDILVIPIAWSLAYWVRYNFDVVPTGMIEQGIQSLLYIIPAQIISYWYFGLYRGVWRFASIPDFIRILKATCVGVSLSIILLYAVSNLATIPRTIPILYGLFLIFMLSGSRFAYRWLRDRDIYRSAGKRVLIVGAGRAGEILAREIRQDCNHVHYPVAFVDDDKNKQNREIHGVRVVGGVADIIGAIQKYSIQAIFIALPSANNKQIQAIFDVCQGTQLPVRILPKFDDITLDKVGVELLREVSIDDLLGRDPVSLNWDSISKSLSNKTILVSGGGGSIGSELCRQLCQLSPQNLIIFEQSEFNLYEIERELKAQCKAVTVIPYLGDVAISQSLDECFSKYKPDIVFHAAAYKHVPMLEANIREGFNNNVVGSNNIIKMADKHLCETFVLVSTDKAVNPTNYMGASKRISEQCCQLMSQSSKTKFVTIRFGNVLGSAGSVIPLFKEQISNGGPVTVTHPEIVRYFMTIKEACQLIMQSAVIGKGGEIFVLDMGKPVLIKNLAEKMIRLSGKIPYDDINIEYTGLRPGEKLYEELFYDEEKLKSTGFDKIQLANSASMDLKHFQNLLSNIISACENYQEQELIELVKPRYLSQNDADLALINNNIIPIKQNY